MAELKRFVCSHCRYLIEALSQGEAYFISDAGKLLPLDPARREEQLAEFLQQSAGRDLIGAERDAFIAQRTGTLSPMLCVACGSTFKRDTHKPEASLCPRRKCQSKNVFPTWQLEGKPCPSCKTGHFKLKRLLTVP